MSDDMERLITMTMVIAAPLLFFVAFHWSARAVWP
jgi:hypothetical protein